MEFSLHTNLLKYDHRDFFRWSLNQTEHSLDPKQKDDHISFNSKVKPNPIHQLVSH